MRSARGVEQAARISPVLGSVTMTLPALPLASSTAWTICSSATRWMFTSSEMMMSWPSVASLMT